MGLMRKLLPQGILIVGMAVAWIAGIAPLFSTPVSTDAIVQQIEDNESLKTYKSALPLYDQMIEAFPDDIQWYERKANAYYELEAYKDYLGICQLMIKTFPDNAAGYEKTMAYYVETDDTNGIFSFWHSLPEDMKANEALSDAYGNVAYAYSYSGTFSYAEPILNGFGVVATDGYYGYVNGSGSQAMECAYQDAKPLFDGGLVAVCQDNEWILVDAQGYRIRASHDAIEDLDSPSGGFCRARVNGREGYYDANLENPQHFEYEAATSFLNGVAAVKQSDGWVLINDAFEPIVDQRFEDVIVDFSNVCSRKGFIFAKTGGSYQLFDLEGNRIGDETFDNAKLFYSDRAAVQQDGKWGFVDTSGQLIIPCSYDDAESFNGGLAPVMQNDVWGFIDEEEQMVVAPEFGSASIVCGDGCSAVLAGETMRYIKFYRFAYGEGA